MKSKWALTLGFRGSASVRHTAWSDRGGQCEHRQAGSRPLKRLPQGLEGKDDGGVCSQSRVPQRL
jgi:hypothetical protein